MTAAGNIAVGSDGAYSAGTSGSKGVIGKYHVQLDDVFDDYEEAEDTASEYDGGYPAYIAGNFVVRIGCWTSEDDAEDALDELDVSGEVVSGSSTGVVVTVTKTTEVLF